jgi:AcrR family transcriptional regulator
MSSPTSRAPLSKHAVVDAALDLVDRDGVAALSIRRLAAQVRVPPMSLYAHFSGKAQLEDLMFDRLVQRLFAAHDGLDGLDGLTWQQELEAVSRHARGVLLAHPHWLPILTRAALPTSSLGFYDRLLRLMAHAGLSREAAMHAFSSAASFALGSVLAERMMTPHPGASIPVRRLVLLRDALPAMPAGTHPDIAATVPVFPRWSFDEVFDLGLRSLVAGIEARFADPGAHKRHRST